MNTNKTPRNAQQANAQATRLQRARAIIEQGYSFEKVDDMIAVVKPGTTAAAYWIGEHVDGSQGCSCPDACKGNDCKHLLAWDLIQQAEAEEVAGLEAQAAAYDAENEELPEFDATRVLLLSEFRRAEKGLAAVDPFSTSAQNWRERMRECDAAMKLHDEVALKQRIAYYRGEPITA